MYTNYYKIVKQFKSSKIIIFAPTCFGLHKPSSGSYSMCFGKVAKLTSVTYPYLNLSVLWLRMQVCWQLANRIRMELREQDQDGTARTGSGRNCANRIRMELREQNQDGTARKGSGRNCANRIRMELREQNQDGTARTGSGRNCANRIRTELREQDQDGTARTGSGWNCANRIRMELREQDQDGIAVPSWSCSQAVSKPAYAATIPITSNNDI